MPKKIFLSKDPQKLWCTASSRVDQSRQSRTFDCLLRMASPRTGHGISPCSLRERATPSTRACISRCSHHPRSGKYERATLHLQSMQASRGFAVSRSEKGPKWPKGTRDNEQGLMQSLASEAKPANYYNQNVDKKTTKKILSWFLDNYGPSRTSEFLEELKSVGFHYATEAGVSLGFDDLKIPARKNIILNQAEKQIYSTEKKFTHGRITAVERYQKVIDIWTTASENLKDEVISNFKSTDLFNPLYMMAFSGARGNISQVRQLVGMRGLMSDSAGGIIDFPIRANFREGLTITEYVISCYGARKGLIDTALRTADSGYLTRRLVDVAHGIMIGSIECGTTESFPIYPLKSPDSDTILLSLEKRIIGRVNASNNEEISPLTAYDLTTDMVSGPCRSAIRQSHAMQSRHGQASSDLLAELAEPRSANSAKKAGVDKILHIKHELPSSINIRSPLTCGFQIRSLPEPQSLAMPCSSRDSHHPRSGKYERATSAMAKPATEPEPAISFAEHAGFTGRGEAGLRSLDGVDRRQTMRSLSSAMPSQSLAVRSQSPATRSQSDGQSEDICQLCYGWSLAHSRLVSIGEAVGVLAAQSIGEPGTQLTMRTFHTGGIFSTDIDAKIFAPHDGYISFPDIDFQGSNSRSATKSILRGHKIRTFFGETAFFLFYPIQLKIYSLTDRAKLGPCSLAGNGVASPALPCEASPIGSAMRTYGMAEPGSAEPAISFAEHVDFARRGEAGHGAGSQVDKDVVDYVGEVDYVGKVDYVKVERNAPFSLLSIPAQSLIFVYPGQKVYKNTLCAEIAHFIQAKLENPEADLGESTMSNRGEPTPQAPAIGPIRSAPRIGEAVQATPKKTKPSNSLEMLTPSTMLPETLPSSVTKKVLSDIEGQIQLCPFYQMSMRQRLGRGEQGVAGHTKQFIAEQSDRDDSIVSSTSAMAKPHIRNVKGTGSIWVLYGQSLSLSGPCYTGDFFTKNLGLRKPYHLGMTHLPRAIMSSESSFQVALLGSATALSGSAAALPGSAAALPKQGPTNQASRAGASNSWFIKWIRSLAKPAIGLRANSFGVANFARLRNEKPTKPSLRTALANDVPRFRSTKLLSTPSTMLCAGHVSFARVQAQHVGFASFAKHGGAEVANVARSTESLAMPCSNPGSHDLRSGKYEQVTLHSESMEASHGVAKPATEPEPKWTKPMYGSAENKNEQGLGDGLPTGPVFMATGETHFVRPALSAMFIGSALKQQANIYGVETLLAEPGMASTVIPKPKSGDWPRLPNKRFGEIRSTGYLGEATRRNSNSLLLKTNDVTGTTSLSLTSSSLPFPTFRPTDEVSEPHDANEVTAEAYMSTADKTKQGYVKQSRNYAGVGGLGRKVIESGLIVEKMHLRQWNIVPSIGEAGDAPSEAGVTPDSLFEAPHQSPVHTSAPSAKRQSPVPVRQAGQSRPTNPASLGGAGNKDKYVASFADDANNIVDAGSAEDRNGTGRTSYVWVLPGSATALPKQGPSDTKKPIQNQITLKIGECIRFDKMSQIIIRMNSSRGAILRRAKPQKGAFSIISRKIHPYLISNNSILAVRNGETVTQRQLLFELVFEKSKTGDIVQGLPKIEQLFEARRTSIHVLNTIHEQLRLKHIEFTRIFEPIEAARRAIRFIQRILVDEIQIVYQSQGVDISDKHIEIIVRQMTSKVIISDQGTTSFYPDDIIDFKSITSLFRISSAPSDLGHMAERGMQAPYGVAKPATESAIAVPSSSWLAGIGSVASPDEAYAMPDEPGFAKERTALPKQEPSTRQSQTNNIVDADRVGHQSPGYAIDKSEAYMLTDRPVDAIGLHFEPTVLGITKRAFLSDSWASSASFQEAKKVLMESALESKIDFLYGLKSNLIVGRYIRAGTSFQ